MNDTSGPNVHDSAVQHLAAIQYLRFICSMALKFMMIGGAKGFAPMPKLSTQAYRVDPATKDVRIIAMARRISSLAS